MTTATGFDTDVLIVGYGPSGVSAANFLGAYGVQSIALERDVDLYQRARAVTVNDWTLRCYQSVGLDAALMQNMEAGVGLRWKTYAGREILRMPSLPSTLGHPSGVAIYQPVMEQTLRDGARRFAEHVEVRYGQELTGLMQDADGVIATVSDRRTGEVRTLRARYVLACDGGSSAVRGMLGVKLVGSTHATRWVVIDARVKRWWPERNIHTFWADKRRPVVDIPLAVGNHRWEFPLEANESDEDFASHAQLWQLLNSLGVTKNEVEIHQHAFYNHHVRHAERWRDGRVFLLGDAAHMMPPWAGQGMQSGVRDAFNLSWKLREVLAGRLSARLLDSYEPERAPDVAELTAVSERLGRMIRLQMTPAERAMTFVASMAMKLRLPIPSERLMQPPRIAQGWLRGAVANDSAVGRMLPQPRVIAGHTRFSKLDDCLSSGFTLLGAGIDPSSLLTIEEKAAWDALGASYRAVYATTGHGQADTDLIDVDGILGAWMGRYRTRVVAVRPDRFVAAAEGRGLAVPAL